MKHVVIGTAGHVDHGKTALVRALTGVDTDRLAEEKRRGLTIELGFARLDFPDGSCAGVVDVPGHEKFIKTMLAGAGGIDLAMLVVAADEGFMPQTVEHLNILSLLGVRRGVVVLTKCDLADADWLAMARAELAARVKGTFLENAPVVETSAATGQGIEDLREMLHALVRQTREKSARHRHAHRGRAARWRRGRAAVLRHAQPRAQFAGPRGKYGDRRRRSARGGESGGH